MINEKSNKNCKDFCYSDSIVVLSFGAAAIINQFSQLNSETSKSLSFVSPQIQKNLKKQK